MRFQDHIIKSTKQSIKGLFRAARAVPEDKVNWQPLDNGRTVIDQLQEVSQAPLWFSAVLEQKADPKFPDEQWAKAKEMRKAWDSIDKCEAACQENSEKMFELIRNAPDEDLHTTITFEGSDDEYTLLDVMSFHKNHLTYHYGQINYMQTLYGDFDNH